MSTTALESEPRTRGLLLASSTVDKLSGWTLILPFVFLACHGVFSFQSDGPVVGGFLPGTVEPKNPGFLGYVVIPAIAYGTVLWNMKGNWERVRAYAAHFTLLTGLAVLTIVSFLWSQNPLRSAEFGLFYLLGTLFAYYLVIRFEPQEIMTLITGAAIVLSVLSLIMVVFFPQHGLASDLRSPGSWRGIFHDKAQAAKVMVFMLSPALASWETQSITRQLVLIALPLLLIVEAHAVTGFIVLVLYVAFLGCLRLGRKFGSKLSLAFIVCVAIGAVGLAVWGFEYLPDLLQSLGRDPTLTGRTIIWHTLMSSVAKRPLLGYGFYSFWQGAEGESGNVINANHWSFGYAHNGTLEIVLQFGFVGLLLFLATVVQAMKNAWYCFRYDRSRRNDWFLGLLFLTLIYNLDEVTVLYPNDLLSILYIVACCGLGQRAQEIKRSRRMGEGLYI